MKGRGNGRCTQAPFLSGRVWSVFLTESTAARNSEPITRPRRDSPLRTNHCRQQVRSDGRAICALELPTKPVLRYHYRELLQWNVVADIPFGFEWLHLRVFGECDTAVEYDDECGRQTAVDQHDVVFLWNSLEGFMSLNRPRQVFSTSLELLQLGVRSSIQQRSPSSRQSLRPVVWLDIRSCANHRDGQEHHPDVWPIQ